MTTVDIAEVDEVPIAPPGAGHSEWCSIPSLPQLGRRAVPQILEGAVAPLVLFLVAMRLWGVAVAIVVGLGWSVVSIMRRVLRRRRVPGLVILAALMLLVRSLFALATGNIFFYFLQPTLGTTVVAAAFLLSVPLDRPLAKRFAADFCALPSHILDNAHVHRFFLRISTMWALIGFANAALTLWLLLSQSTATFLVLKTVLSVSATVGPVVISVLWFRRAMSRSGVVVVRA